MKIKDVRKYRNEYKVKIRKLSDSRDENFVGTFYYDQDDEQKYGWFDIYHGDKEGVGDSEEGIGNFLQSFLDMAKDGQAVYEFLQNAVDAGSTHFGMFWGEDEIDGNQYLLISNNGAMFEFENIRSILNVGSSTKNANSHTIGKFGIGFKLAHRLVGKENGLDELLTNYYGPLLFSWKNNEIEQLAAAEKIEPVDIRFTKKKDNPRLYEIKDDNPWLFKILLTCFPCLPENEYVTDEIRLLDDRGTIVDGFNKEEYEAFCRWVQKYSDLLKGCDYQEGSLIFIKLGEGKVVDLADRNLASGIKFSLAVLEKTSNKSSGMDRVLKTVQLNRESVIEYPDLNYLTFYISRDGEDRSEYVYVRFGIEDNRELREDELKILEKETDIEVLFGFRDYDKIDTYFKGAPNFYLYFPLSEEVHNFNFILHSNAFYKASSRTFLHKGTGAEYGINERLLSVITKRVDKELYRLYQENDANFINLYVSFLTSRESSNQERNWIQEPFINRIKEILLKYIPVKSSHSLGYELRKKSEAIYIKGTKVDVPLEKELLWFYFEQDDIVWAGKDKLDLKVFNIFDLLDISEIYISINEWIGTDQKKIELILGELDDVDWKNLSDNQKTNLLNLQVFKFSDGTLASALEVADIQEKGYLVLYNNLSGISEVLQKAGLHITSVDFNEYSNFVPKIMSYLSNTHQLKNHDKTVEIFSRCVNNEILGALPAGDKLAVFRALRDLNDQKKHERISNLKLLKNKAGEYMPFQSLLKKAPTGWLKKYEVAENELHSEYNTYLLDEEEKIYENIVYPYWKDILQTLIGYSADTQLKVKREIIELFDKCKSENKNHLLLKDHNLIPYQGEVIKTEDVFYYDSSDTMYVEHYVGIQKLVHKLTDIYIPDYFYLDFMNDEPFELDSEKFDFPEEMTLSEIEALQLFTFLSVIEETFFENYTLSKYEEDLIELRERKPGEYMYYIDSALVKEYIATFYTDSFFLCPDEFKEFTGLGILRKESLFKQLIDLLDVDNERQLIDLLAILPHSEDLQRLIFDKITAFVLDVSWEEEKTNQVYLKYLSELISNQIISEKEIQDKIEFRKGDATIYLKHIDTADDEIELIINNTDKKCALSKTKLLKLTDELGITDIQRFAQEAVLRELVSNKESIHLFKLRKTEVDAELIKLFDEKLTDMQIENAHQLAFVLCCNNISRKDVASYNVKDAADEWYELTNNWLLPLDNSSGLYKDYYILSSDYKEVIDLLKIQDGESLFYGDDEDENSRHYIYSDFRFLQGYDINVFNEEQENLLLLEKLYECWKKTKKSKRIASTKWEWKTILQFTPALKIYDKQNRIITEEQLEPEIIEWLEEKKDQLLFAEKALGVLTENTDILRLREGLLKSLPSINEVDINSLDLLFLQNTLIGLADGFMNGDKIGSYTKNSKSFQIINCMIQRLIPYKEWTIRVHVYVSPERYTLGSEKASLPFYMEDRETFELISKNSQNKQYLRKLFKKEPIILLLDIYQEYVEEKYTEVEEISIFLIDKDCFEHTEFYYKKWKEETGISLFRINKMCYKISVEINEVVYELGEMERTGLWYDIGDQEIYYPKHFGLEILLNMLLEDKHEYSDDVKKLIEGRDSLLVSLSKNLEEEDDEDLKKLLDEKIEEQGKEEKRKELAEEIASEIPYSYRWFEIYLEYLATFEETVETTVQKSISFQQITTFINGKGEVSPNYFLLKGANRVIPVSLESYTDFEIELSFGPKKKERIKVESVSKKGQDLLVFRPGGIEEKIKKDFDEVKSVAIYFRPGVELLKKLQAEFSILEPWGDILTATQPLHFIYGPPGTGKTTTLSELLIDKYSQNPEFRALVLTPTNKAGDVLAGKIRKESPSAKVIRLSSATDPTLEETMYKSGVNEEVLEKTNILISTIHRLPYTQVEYLSGEFLKLYDVQWDYVIFDESSMISLPYFIFALQAVKRNNENAQIIIAGDPKQIPPIVEATDKQLEDMDLSDISIYTIFNIRDFNENTADCRVCDKVDYLDTQYRSVEEIGQLFSNYSYGGKIKYERDFIKKPRKKLPNNFPTSLKKPIVFIDVPVEEDNSITLPKKLFYSSYHIYSALFVTELVKNLAGKVIEEDPLRIGIISPYKAQAVIMGKLISYLDIPFNLDVRCDTIHGFQGDECDIIIYVVNPNNKSFTNHNKSLLNKEYIYNVAISRAQDYLWVIHPFSTGNPHVQNLKKDAFSRMKGCEIVDCHKLERYLLGSENFITRNSHMTVHDNVNIFGFTEDMSYYVKAGENTIDIQLKK